MRELIKRLEEVAGEKVPVSKLVPFKKYIISFSPSKPSQHKIGPREVTFTGKFPGSDYRCQICDKEGGGSYEFDVGDPDNPDDVYMIGSECARKMDIRLAD